MGGKEHAMSDNTQRLLLRLRRRAVHCYELVLYALLLALALAVAHAAASAAGDEAQCGNTQSSVDVIAR